MAYIRHNNGETPTLRPTFDEKGNEIERIVEPGRKLGTTEGEMNIQTCNCTACQALYAELSGAQQPETAPA